MGLVSTFRKWYDQAVDAAEKAADQRVARAKVKAERDIALAKTRASRQRAINLMNAEKAAAYKELARAKENARLTAKTLEKERRAAGKLTLREQLVEAGKSVRNGTAGLTGARAPKGKKKSAGKKPPTIKQILWG